MKKILTITLFLFVVISFAFLVFKGKRQVEPQKVSGKKTIVKNKEAECDNFEFCGKKQPFHHLEIFYFMTNNRCVSCHKIETFTRYTLKKDFSKELNNGLISFKMVNIQKPQNKHFINDFALYTKSVVVVEKKGDKIIHWKNLGNVWKVLSGKEIFEKYEKKEIETYLNFIKKEQR